MSTLTFQVLFIVACGAVAFGVAELTRWHHERQARRELEPMLEAQSAAMKEAVTDLVANLKRQEVAMLAEIEAARPTDSELIH